MNDYTEAQLDFVLEMAARDDPETYTFNRHGVKLVRAVRMAEWNSVLAGPALQAFMKATGALAALAGAMAWRKRHYGGGGMKLGFTRGGKTVGDDGGHKH